MDGPKVRKAPVVWWAGGLLLGLTLVLAITVKKPLGVSTQFVVAESVAMREMGGKYAEFATNHPVIGDKKQATTQAAATQQAATTQVGKTVPNKKYGKLGYSFWLVVGMIGGAFLAAVFSGRWRLSVSTVWWAASGRGAFSRLLFGFVGGVLILLGARLAHGCTSGQLASGWAQLSLSAGPFTVALFAFGMLAARIFYPKVPEIER